MTNALIKSESDLINYWLKLADEGTVVQQVLTVKILQRITQYGGYLLHLYDWLESKQQTPEMIIERIRHEVGVYTEPTKAGKRRTVEIENWKVDRNIVWVEYTSEYDDEPTIAEFPVSWLQYAYEAEKWGEFMNEQFIQHTGEHNQQHGVTAFENVQAFEYQEYIKLYIESGYQLHIIK